MPRRQPREAIEALEDPLLKAYADAWGRVVELQDRIRSDPARWRERRRLLRAQRQIIAALVELDAQAARWIVQDFAKVYAAGVAAGARDARVVSPAAVWDRVPKEPVQLLAEDLFDDLLKATRNVKRTMRAMVRTVIRDEVLVKAIAGDTAEAAARRAAQLLERRGVYAVRYADGSRHGLAEYTRVAVRTKTAVAYNTGSLGAMTEAGIRYVECFDGAGCGWTSHDDSTPANGRIVTVDQALAQPISHPNCRRAFGGRPDITTPESASTALSTASG